MTATQFRDAQPRDAQPRDAQPRDAQPREAVPSASRRRPRLHLHSDHERFGGCETMLVNLLGSAALKREFDVSFSYRHSPRYAEGLHRRVAVDVPVFPLDFREPSDLFVRGGLSRAPIHRAGRALSRLLITVPLMLSEVVRLTRLFMRIRPDVLHVNNGGYPGALSARAAVVAARLARVPHVIMVLNNHAEGYDRLGRRLEYPVDRAVASSVELFVAGSRASTERIREVLGLDPDHARAVPNGADLRAPNETVAETRARLGLAGFSGTLFGVVAVMEPRKGHRVLIEALHRLVREHQLAASAVRLVFLGDGLLRAELESLVAERGLQGYCRFLGEESNAMNVIAALDVLVLPSLANEDFPNVVLEAMGAGKAVIASRLAGTPEQVVEGDTGLLLPPGDAGALADAMWTLHADPALRGRMGEAARLRYERLFTADAAVDRFAECYRELLAGRSAAARGMGAAT